MKLHTLLYSVLGIVLLSSSFAISSEPALDENPMMQSQIFTSYTTELDAINFRKIPPIESEYLTDSKHWTFSESDTSSSFSDYEYQAPELWIAFREEQTLKFRIKSDKEAADILKVHPGASYYINLPILLATVKEIKELTSFDIKLIDYINSPEGYKLLQEFQAKKSINFPHAMYKVAVLFNIVCMHRIELKLMLEVDDESSVKIRKVVKKLRKLYEYVLNNPYSAG